MSFKTAEVTVAADVATNGTITVAYPARSDSGTFVGTYAHKAWAAGLQRLLSAPADFTVSFGASNITVTYLGATSIPANTRVNFQFDTLGADDRELSTNVANTHHLMPLTPFVINLGAPDTLVADGVSTVQTTAGAANLTITGALASGGVATFDVPRNVTLTGATTDHSAVTATVTGTDEYGNTVVENIACPNNNTVAGKKAFKTVTKVHVDGAIATTGISVGSGDVLGLPVALPQKGLVVKEMEDGVAPTAGTLVAAVTSTATSTTGDVRGTYKPNSACNGAKAFQLLALLPDPTDLGVDQFAG